MKTEVRYKTYKGYRIKYWREPSCTVEWHLPDWNGQVDLDGTLFCTGPYQSVFDCTDSIEHVIDQYIGEA